MSSALERMKAQLAARNAAKETKDETIQSATQQVQSDGINLPTEEQKVEEVESQAEQENQAQPVDPVEVQDPEVPQPEQANLAVPKSNHPLALEMAELQQQLENNVPGFANKLRDIHVKLRNDPNIVTLLTDEEIGVIVAGLEKHTNVQIVAPAAIKASKRAAKTPVTALDL